METSCCLHHRKPALQLSYLVISFPYPFLFTISTYKGNAFISNKQKIKQKREYPLTTPIRVGDKAEDGSQLRPYIVMFGEYVDSMNVAIDIVSKADIFVVIGTSLKVYPAAGFINYAHHEVPKFVIDPGEMEQCTHLGFTHFKTTATEGMKMLLEAFKEL